MNEATSYVEVPSSNVVVVTGHRDRSMADHLQRLKNAGVLKGKIVAVLSCYGEGVEGLQSDLVAGANGAKAILYYSTPINPGAVQSMMLELSRQLSSNNKGFAALRLDNLIKQSVDRALKNADFDSEKEELKKLQNPIIQLSRLRFDDQISGTDS
jgi:hypothetical protein